MKRTKGITAAVAALTVLAVAPAADAKGAGTFDVTFTDLTSGQPLTPAVAATHRGKNELFRVGRAASFGLKEIAENGNNAPMLSRLAADDDVFHVLDRGGARRGLPVAGLDVDLHQRRLHRSKCAEAPAEGGRQRHGRDGRL